MSERLRNFAADLLEHSGAVIERIEPNGLEVLSPPEVRKVLPLPELARLGFSPELPPNAEQVGLESNWLDHFQELLGEKGQWTGLNLNSGFSPPSNPERTLEHVMSLQNATYRFVKANRTRTRYLLLVFRYTALSEEKREGIVRIGFNLSNGATMDGLLEALWPALFSGETMDLLHESFDLPLEEDLPAVWDRKKLLDILQRTLSRRVELRLERFIQGLARRQERDLDRLHDYFSDMRRETLERMAKDTPGADIQTRNDGQARHRTRLESIEREYRSKVIDLRQKYALNVETTFVQGLLLEMPVHRFELLIKRRKGERRFHLDWNPLVRKLETPPCEYSFTQTPERMVCDDALHLVTPGAHSECTECGKPFCRACHVNRCPKCKKRY